MGTQLHLSTVSGLLIDERKVGRPSSRACKRNKPQGNTRRQWQCLNTIAQGKPIRGRWAQVGSIESELLQAQATKVDANAVRVHSVSAGGRPLIWEKHMEDRQRRETFELLQRLADGIVRLFSPHCEVVIHDFTDFEHSIVHIEGDVSSRQLGGAATDLLLERARDHQTDEDLYCYKTNLAGNRVMKSSTVFLRDKDGAAYGAFCLNYDITALSELETAISAMTLSGVDQAVSEVLSDDINETIRGIISETLAEIGDDPRLMRRDGKIEFIARLDAKGIFQVRKAATIVAEQLGFSRATIYNYLREARDQNIVGPSDNSLISFGVLDTSEGKDDE